MAKKRINIEEELRVWANTLSRLADLQRELVLVSQGMTPLEIQYADWLEPHRQLVFGVWETLATTKPEDRMEAAKTLREQIETSLIVVQEIKRMRNQ